MSGLFESLPALIMQYGLNILGAIAVLVFGYMATKFIISLLRKVLTRSDVDETLSNFSLSLAYYALLTYVGITALATLGVQTASLVAVIGAAGLAIGLALQGSLANFAAGVMIVFFRPYKVGDLVEIVGSLGVVDEIQIFNTSIITPDNKKVIISNSKVTDNNITNYSAMGVIRLDMVFGIGYGDDLLKAKAILQELLDADGRVAKEPSASVTVLELADSSVNFAVRPYVTVEDYWGVYFDITEAVKLRFDAEGISIPFPQQDVHLVEAKLPMLQISKN